ncbi:MAG TPA: hypothetical protein VF765_01510 [Polyangiaceae bacterium]
MPPPTLEPTRSSPPVPAATAAAGIVESSGSGACSGSGRCSVTPDGKTGVSQVKAQFD